jgi:hypothetical protein
LDSHALCLHTCGTFLENRRSALDLRYLVVPDWLMAELKSHTGFERTKWPRVRYDLARQSMDLDLFASSWRGHGSRRDCGANLDIVFLAVFGVLWVCFETIFIDLLLLLTIR